MTTTTERINITVRFEADKVMILDELATLSDRDRSYLIREAVNEYIELRQWQIEEIRKAIAEANAGDFVPEDEMKQFFDKWTR
ncbi:MAG: ribbon-helix-helix protein, CopG family [Rectinemataceae bacterium]|nr:ribbon-helix-helix protein, CopG family [Rectinemataceae bacterium]